VNLEYTPKHGEPLPIRIETEELQQMQATADSRDMIVAHVIYRRETRSLAELITGVEAGDDVRAAIVAEHVRFVVDLVHFHHRAEDGLVWPKLRERAAAALEPIVETMESQHSTLDVALQDLEARALRWGKSGSAEERDVLAAAAAHVHAQLTEHLDLEEKEVLSLIDQHLTAAEWAEVAAAVGASLSVDQKTLVFGMAVYDASPEMVEILKGPIPTDLWKTLDQTGRQAYADYALEVFGTTTPPHYT
jgi:hemerythrin-like domain-containing protein